MATTLEETLSLALRKTRNGARRQGEETLIPLRIWNDATFQSWHQERKAAGERIESVTPQWIARTATQSFVPMAGSENGGGGGSPTTAPPTRKP